jgi:hypothetical protein
MLTWLKKFFKRTPKCEHRFDSKIVSDFNEDDPKCIKCGRRFSMIACDGIYRFVAVNNNEFGLIKVKR